MAEMTVENQRGPERLHSPAMEPAPLPSSATGEHWYAAYTCANHEKRVAEQLGVRAVEHFLPLYSSVRRWKDRRVMLELPLFPGYVFVRMALRDRLQVQTVPGVARLVAFDRTPAALPDGEIDSLRTSLGGAVRAEPHPYLVAGRRVRVIRGPLVGMEGVLLRRKSGFRLVISVELIQRSVAVSADAADVELISGIGSRTLNCSGPRCEQIHMTDFESTAKKGARCAH